MFGQIRATPDSALRDDKFGQVCGFRLGHTWLAVSLAKAMKQMLVSEQNIHLVGKQLQRSSCSGYFEGFLDGPAPL